MTGREIESEGWPRVFPSAAEMDREVFNRIAQTNPGIVRTLLLLLAELSDLDGLAPDLRRALGEHLRRVGDTVIARAEHADGGDGHAE